MSNTKSDLDKLLETYPADVQEITLITRQMIGSTIPNLVEMVDQSARVIGYGFGPTYKDMICTIILSKGGVKLGIVGGAALPDPKGLLEGTGKRHRYVVIAKPSDVEKPGLKALLKAGVAAWKGKKAST